MQQTSLLDEDDYPEILRELMGVIGRELVAIFPNVEEAYASAVAETVAEHVREHFGGVPQYWPKGTSFRARKRREQMWQAFNGNNHVVLARRFGMCLQNVYKNLAIAKAEQTNKLQRKLPGAEEWAA